MGIWGMPWGSLVAGLEGIEGKEWILALWEMMVVYGIWDINVRVKVMDGELTELGKKVPH